MKNKEKMSVFVFIFQKNFEAFSWGKKFSNNLLLLRSVVVGHFESKCCKKYRFQMLKYCNYCSFLMKFIYKWELGSFREPKTATIVLISTYLPTSKDRYPI